MVHYFFGSLFNKTNTVYKLCMYWNRHLNIVTSMVSDVSGKKIKSIITYELWWVNGAPCTGESSNLVMVNQNLSDHDVLALLPVIEPWTKKTPNQGNTHLSQFGQTMVVFWTSGRPEVGPWAFFFWYEDCRFWNVVVWCCVLWKFECFRFMDTVYYVCMFNNYYVSICSEWTLVPSRQMSSSLLIVIVIFHRVNCKVLRLAQDEVGKR